MKHLAVIPARGGSTRLKDKNVYPVNGKPLISYTIEAAVEAGVFSKVMVSTDAPKIMSVAETFGVEIHQRPEQFAGERVTVLEAILDLMNSSDEVYDTITYLLPTCPFRNGEDIKKGITLLDESADTVISTCFYEEPIQLAMIPGETGFAYPVFDNLRQGLTNSKFIQKYIRPNGGFYMGHWDHVSAHRSFFKGRIKTVLLPKERSVDIDTIEDIVYAAAIAQNQND